MAKLLILAAIAQVFALAIIARVLQQTEAVNLIVQKAALVNVQRDVEKVLSHPSGCLSALQPAGIEASRLMDPHYRVELNRILEPGPSPRPVVAVGEAPYGMSGNARIETIELARFARVSADVFEVDLNLSAKVYSQKVTGYPMRLRLEWKASELRSCSILSATHPGSSGSCRIVESDDSRPGRAECAASEKRISGGGTCLDGYMTMSEPVETHGWLVDCRGHANSVKTPGKAFAYCCVF